MKSRNFTLFLVAYFALGIVLFTSGSALGSGFALIEQSVSGLGNSFPGGAAGAEDASTVFFRMSCLDGTQIIAAGTLVAPSMKFHNEGSTHALQGVTHVPLIGNNGGDAGVARLVPNFYITKKINNKFTFGLGVNAPFGLTTEYDKIWIGRYHAINSEMTTIDINPTVSYRISEHLSAGAGINIQRIDAELSSAIDFGTLEPKINKDPTGEDATRGGLKGRYDAHVDLLGLQVGIRF